jgi:hypothetical protein
MDRGIATNVRQKVMIRPADNSRREDDQSVLPERFITTTDPLGSSLVSGGLASTSGPAIDASEEL